VYYFEEGTSLGGLDISADGTVVATGDSHGRVRLWDAFDLRTLRSLEAHEAAINGVAFAPTIPVVAAAADGRALSLNLTTDEIRPLLEDDGRSFTAIRFAPDGASLAIGDATGRVDILHHPSGEWAATPIAEGPEIASVAYNPEGSLLAIGTGGGGLHVWNAQQGGLVTLVEPEGSDGLVDVTFQDPTRVVFRRLPAGVEVWDVVTQRPVRTLNATAAGNLSIAGPLGPNHVFACGPEELFVFEIESGSETAMFEIDAFVPRAVATPDGNAIVVGGLDNIQVFRWSDALRRSELRKAMSAWNVLAPAPSTAERVAILAEWYYLNGWPRTAASYVQHADFAADSLRPLMLARIWEGVGEHDQAQPQYEKALLGLRETSPIYAALLERLERGQVSP
jgi:WD40 repeat protein